VTLFDVIFLILIAALYSVPLFVGGDEQ